MPDLSHLLTHSSAAELARLHELLDSLFTSRRIEPAAGLPEALARLQPGGTATGASVDALAEDRWDALPGSRLDASAVSLAGFGAASALLLQEQFGPVAAAESVAQALAAPAGRGEGNPASGPATPEAAASLSAIPLATEADWAAAGAHDHALLEAHGGGVFAALPGGDAGTFAQEIPAAAGDVLASLDHAIAQLDGQIAGVGDAAAFLDVPVQPAEVAAAVDALAAHPLPELLAATREAAASFQQQADVAVDVAVDGSGASVTGPEDAMPDTAAAVDLVDGIGQLAPDIVEVVGDVLDQVAAVTPGGALVPVTDLVADVLEGGSALLPQLLDTLAGVTAPVEALVDQLDLSTVVDLVDGVTDAAGQLAAGVVDSVIEVVGGAVGDVAVDVAGDAMGGVVGAVDGVLGGAVDGLEALVQGVLTPGPAATQPALVDAVEQLGAALPLEPLVDGLQDLVGSVVQGTSPASQDDGSGLPGLLPSLGTELVGDTAHLLQGLPHLLKPGA